MLQAEREQEKPSKEKIDSKEEELLAISDATLKRIEGSHTMRMLGKVQQYDVIILVDLGSSASFISEVLAGNLTGA